MPEINPETMDQNLKLEVALIKKDIAMLTTLCSKMDLVIEKLLEQDDKIFQQIANEFHRQEKETDSKLQSLNQEIEKKVEAKIDAVKSKVDDIEQQLGKIMKWSWLLIGGIITASLLLRIINADILVKVLTTLAH